MNPNTLLLSAVNKAHKNQARKARNRKLIDAIEVLKEMNRHALTEGAGITAHICKLTALIELSPKLIEVIDNLDK